MSTPNSIVNTVIGLAKDDSSNVVINKTKDIHGALPELLYLLGGSAVNQAFFEVLDTKLSEGGRLEGQSKRDPDDDDTLIIADEGETEYIRPNGEIYFARDWTGMQDVRVLRLARENNQYPLLYGEPGCGKTALAEAAFGEDLITMIFTGDTAERDLVGQFIPNPDFGQPNQPEFTWIDGPLVVAMEKGLPFLCDEIGLGDPKVLSVLYGAMDGRREVVVASNPHRGVVRAAEGFFVIAATNPKAPGVNLSEALLSRFTMHAEMTTDYALAVSKLGVPETVTGIARSLAGLKAGNQIDWAPQMRELIAFRDISKVYGEKFAYANLIAACPFPLDREQVQEAIRRITQANHLAARI